MRLAAIEDASDLGCFNGGGRVLWIDHENLCWYSAACRAFAVDVFGGIALGAPFSVTAAAWPGRPAARALRRELRWFAEAVTPVSDADLVADHRP